MLARVELTEVGSPMMAGRRCGRADRFPGKSVALDEIMFSSPAFHTFAVRKPRKVD